MQLFQNLLPLLGERRCLSWTVLSSFDLRLKQIKRMLEFLRIIQVSGICGPDSFLLNDS